MDRVRLGRVLGKGARLAARTAYEAVDAATAAAPPAARVRPEERAAGEPLSGKAARVVPGEVLRTIPVVKRAGQGAVNTAFAPWRSASRALWYELTGSFFALFAVSFAAGVWHTRSAMASSNPLERYRLYAFCALALVFAYFSVSSFLRARKRPA